jgi:hypothetical protein
VAAVTHLIKTMGMPGIVSEAFRSLQAKTKPGTAVPRARLAAAAAPLPSNPAQPSPDPPLSAAGPTAAAQVAQPSRQPGAPPAAAEGRRPPTPRRPQHMAAGPVHPQPHALRATDDTPAPAPAPAAHQLAAAGTVPRTEQSAGAASRQLLLPAPASKRAGEAGVAPPTATRPRLDPLPCGADAAELSWAAAMRPLVTPLARDAVLAATGRRPTPPQAAPAQVLFQPAPPPAPPAQVLFQPAPPPAATAPAATALATTAPATTALATTALAAAAFYPMHLAFPTTVPEGGPYTSDQLKGRCVGSWGTSGLDTHAVATGRAV